MSKDYLALAQKALIYAAHRIANITAVFSTHRDRRFTIHSCIVFYYATLSRQYVHVVYKLSLDTKFNQFPSFYCIMVVCQLIFLTDHFTLCQKKTQKQNAKQFVLLFHFTHFSCDDFSVCVCEMAHGMNKRKILCSLFPFFLWNTKFPTIQNLNHCIVCGPGKCVYGIRN